MTDQTPPTGNGERFDSVAACIRSRRMIRDFTGEPLGADLVDGVLDLARRAPSAGNTQPCDFLVLRDEDVDRYWRTTLTEQARDRFRWQGLLAAPVLVVVYVDPHAYVSRYAEPDKAATGLGAGVDAWTVPYWWVDGGAAVENLLLAAHDAGLGASLFGQFAHEAAVRAAFGVPDGRRAVATIALGWPAPTVPGRSSTRPRRPLRQIVHRGRWQTGQT